MMVLPSVYIKNTCLRGSKTRTIEVAKVLCEYIHKETNKSRNREVSVPAGIGDLVNNI